MKEFAGKKILIIVENLPVPFDRRVWQEATALKNKGASVSIICPVGKGYEKKFEIINDIAIYRHKLPIEAKRSREYILEYTAALFWEFILSIKIFLKKGFDVIHSCNPPDLIFLIGIFFKLFKKKFVFDHHDLCPELYLSKFKKREYIYKMLLFLERMTFKLADISIATNQSYRKIAINRGGMSTDDVFIVRSGPDLKRLKIVSPDERFKNGRKYLIGYVGVIGEQEGLNYLVDACKYIVQKKQREDIHFICVGEGTELKNVKRYAKKQLVSDYFTFTGRVPDEVLLKALNTADVCVNPDEYNEMNDKSTMNKIMEYMALKKPIVQFDLKEGRVSAQNASLYAKPNDFIDLAMKILQLIDDPKKRKEMGEYGYDRVKGKLQLKYEKENLYKAYRKLFSK